MKRKRKPDLLAVLAIVVSLGVVASSLAQGMLNSTATPSGQLAQQIAQQSALTQPALKQAALK
ncbi:hypothetical protein [Kaarinaea lacus]